MALPHSCPMLLLVVSLFLPVFSDAGKCTGKLDVLFKQTEVMSIDVNAWTSHSLTSHVAKIILEETMGYNVELKVDTLETTTFDRLIAENGTPEKVHMNLEMWVSTKAADIKAVVDAGVFLFFKR